MLKYGLSCVKATKACTPVFTRVVMRATILGKLYRPIPIQKVSLKREEIVESGLKSIRRPRLNFIFTLSFYARRSQKHKKTDNLTVFFMLLGSTCVKAARRTLKKFSPIRRTLKEPSKVLHLDKCQHCQNFHKARNSKNTKRR